MLCARCATRAAPESTISAPWTPSTSRRPWRMDSSIDVPSAPQRGLQLLLEESDGFRRIHVDPEYLLLVDRDQARAPGEWIPASMSLQRRSAVSSFFSKSPMGFVGST